MLRTTQESTTREDKEVGKGKKMEKKKGGDSLKEAVPSSIRGEAQRRSLGTAGGRSPASL